MLFSSCKNKGVHITDQESTAYSISYSGCPSNKVYYIEQNLFWLLGLLELVEAFVACIYVLYQ